MDSIEKLTEIFRRFPGIGPRQAKRFVYFLLYQPETAGQLTQVTSELIKESRQCQSCQRFLSAEGLADKKKNICRLCLDPEVDETLLMVVEKDIDLENIRQAGIYKGCFFVLGGLVPILEKEPQSKIRLKELLSRINSEPNLKEIILALGVNPLGDNTAQYLKEKIEPLAAKKSLKISTLGRGLSTGTELEYLDDETIKNALKNRA